MKNLGPVWQFIHVVRVSTPLQTVPLIPKGSSNQILYGFECLLIAKLC